MSNIIDSIQLSGTVYTLSAQTSGGNPTVELTQAQYDALVTAGTVQADTYYIITDAQAGDLTNYYTKSETNTLLGGKADTATTYTKTEVDTALAGKQTTLTAGTGIDITDNVISATGGGGGGKAIEAGTNISVTTGETADTINCTLPISATSQGIYTTSSNPFRSSAPKQGNVIFGSTNFIEVFGSSNSGNYNTIFGNDNQISPSRSGSYNFIGGNNNVIFNKPVSYATIFGYYNFANNGYETSLGIYNNSVNVSTTFGNSGNTLFSVGNGTADNARHNAFEIRQNGDIYITSGNSDIKLQDYIGGSITVVQTTGTSTTDVMSQNAVTTQLNDYVTTNTEQTISGKKIFKNSDKPIEFKQTSNSSKVGFSIKNSASTSNELATFELRPNTFTIDGVQHPLLYFGHYRNTNTANAGVPQTVVGFRQYDQLNAAAYHYLLPLPEKAKTPFSLTTSFKDYYAPMGFKNGSTMITADETGVVDLSSELGGLKLKKLTQAEYDALATKDNSTLYVIVN